MSTTTEHLVAILHAFALTVAIAIAGMPTPASARGPSAQTKSETKSEAKEPAGEAPVTAEPSSPKAGPASPQTVEGALEGGDLETAMKLATEAREKDPTPAAWRLEAQVAERRGDLAAAEAAYRGELKALPKDDAEARARAEQDLARVTAQARGTIPGEPKSQHRAELDRKWDDAPKAKAAPDEKKRRTVPPPGPRPREDRIVTKWYFWVTVGAIVASAAAVTAIAIRAARDDEPDALGFEAGPRSMGATLLRF